MRMFGRLPQEETEELLAFVETPAPTNDPAIRQAIDTLARRAVAQNMDAGERRDWWDGINEAVQERIDTRVGELVAEMDATIRQVETALKLLKGLNR